MQRRVRETRTRRSRRSVANVSYVYDTDSDIDEAPLEPAHVTAARHRSTSERVKASGEESSAGRKRRRLSVPAIRQETQEPPSRVMSPMLQEAHTRAPAGTTDTEPIVPDSKPAPTQDNTTEIRTKDVPAQDVTNLVESAITDATAALAQVEVSAGDGAQQSGGEEQEEEEEEGWEDNTQTHGLAAQLEQDPFPVARVTERTGEHLTRDNGSTVTEEATIEHVNTRTLRTRVRALLSWQTMLSFMVIGSGTSFSATQYEQFRQSIAGVAGMLGHGEVKLPQYKNVRNQMRTNLVKWCFPRSSISFVHGIERPRGTQRATFVHSNNAGRKPAQACVRLVPPSEWAKLDVCTYTFYSDVYEHPLRDRPEHLSIESAPIVQLRAPVIGNEEKLWCNYGGAPCLTRQGDVVDIPCAARPRQADERYKLHDEWFRTGTEGSSTQVRAGSEGSSTHVRAVVCGSWLIGAVPELGARSAGPSNLPRGGRWWSLHERALMSKFAKPSPNQPAMDTVLERSGDADDGETETSRVQSRLAHSTNVVQLHPGDQCVLLRAQQSHEAMRANRSGYQEPARTQHCMLIGSLVGQATGFPAERLVWVDIEERGDGRATVRYVGTSNVTELPTWVSGNQGTPDVMFESNQSRDLGYLEDGSRYIVYRFALYMDGFKQHTSNTDMRSVGGCYLLPLGLSMEARRGTGAPRVLTLASCALSHNRVMEALMEDICRAATEGVNGIDPYGRSVRIFLDPVTFFGDYPAAALCADVLGHTANAYCTHCTVVKAPSPTGSSILCTAMNNSRRVGYMRTDARLKSIRESPLHSNVYNKIGMKSQDRDSGALLPLVSLSERLGRATRPERDCEGREITSLMFESSQSCAAVPDHMFTGLIKNMLQVSFTALASDERRAAIEKRIASTARDNGLPVTGYIVNWGKDGSFKGICNQTMTTLVCILLCAAPAFDSEHRRTGARVFRLARRLQSFASAVYFYPDPKTDGDDHADMFEVGGKVMYYAHLRELASEYLHECDKVMEENKEHGAVLDKPNAHRAVELVVHTVPTFGHARNCSELVLEGMHQVFKGWLARNTHDNSHITAVERALTKDWMGRVYALFKIWEGGNCRERACAEVGLRRLLLGEEALRMDERQPGVSGLKQEFHSGMRDAFRGHILSMMAQSGHTSLPRARYVKWEVDELDRVKPAELDSLGMAFRRGRALLINHYGLRAGQEMRVLSVYRAARRVNMDVFEGRRKAYLYNEAARGTVVSCAAPRTSGVVEAEECGRGRLRLHGVVCMVRGSDGKLWCVTMPMQRVRTSARNIMEVMLDGCVVLEMSESVRRAGAAHVCEDSCRVHPRQLHVEHSSGVCEGGHYEVWTRADGYPPHMG